MATKSTRDLTQGNIYSHIIRFAMPLMLSQLFQQLYNTADTFIVGKFLGTDALAAVSASGALIFMLASFLIGAGVGSGIAISRYFGAGDIPRVRKAIGTSFALSIASGIILTLVGVLLTPTFLVWMKTDPEVLPKAIIYFRYFFLGSLSTVVYNFSTGIMNAVGDSKRPLYYLIFSSLLNIGLDLLFIGVFGWGIWSAAIATVIAQTASALLCIHYLWGKKFAFKITIKEVRFHKELFREILKYGIPTGIQNSVIAFANVIVQTQINSFGKFATAGYGVHTKLEGFAFLPIMCFTMAITTFTSQNLGARKYDRAKKGATFGILLCTITAEIIGVLGYWFAPNFIGLFDSNPKVIFYGTMQAKTVTLFFFMLAFSHCIAAVCRGAGKALIPMVIMLSVWCVLRVGYISMVMRFLGEIKYIYWAYPITWFISSVIYLVYYIKSDWVHGFET